MFDAQAIRRTQGNRSIPRRRIVRLDFNWPPDARTLRSLAVAAPIGRAALGAVTRYSMRRWGNSTDWRGAADGDWFDRDFFSRLDIRCLQLDGHSRKSMGLAAR